ncbi:MAG: hypothetical protein R3C14_34610 [Caldilineaceae bacterium]
MLALSPQSTKRLADMSVDWFFLGDCIKLPVALLLLILMTCVLYEDVVWLRAIGKSRAALAANLELKAHVELYSTTGEEWRSWQRTLALAAPVTELLHNIMSSPFALTVELFAPQVREGMDDLSQLGQRLLTVEDGLRGLAQSPSLVATSDQFTLTPTRRTLVIFASACSGNVDHLQNIGRELQWMAPLATQIDRGFTSSVDVLAENRGVVPLPADTQIYVDSLLDFLRQQATALRIRAESLRYYQQITAQDVQMMNVIIDATLNAQKKSAFFGYGIWRRWMDTVRANAWLILCANLALLMAEICLYLEQKSKIVL